MKLEIATACQWGHVPNKPNKKSSTKKKRKKFAKVFTQQITNQCTDFSRSTNRPNPVKFNLNESALTMKLPTKLCVWNVAASDLAMGRNLNKNPLKWIGFRLIEFGYWKSEWRSYKLKLKSSMPSGLRFVLFSDWNISNVVAGACWAQSTIICIKSTADTVFGTLLCQCDGAWTVRTFVGLPQ